MKILVFSQYFYPENFRINTFCEELVKKGNEVTVVTGYPQYPQNKIFDGYGFNIPYEKEWNGINIIRVKTYPRGNSALGLLRNCFSYVYSAKKWVKGNKKSFDLVYVFEISPFSVGLPAVFYKKKFDTPIFFNVQDLWPENVEVIMGVKNKIILKYINKMVDKIYYNCDKILCPSKGFMDNIARRNVNKEKLVFWPQFCKTPLLNGEKPSVYKDDTFNVVFTGNVGEAQGLSNLIEVAYLLKDENIRWFIVGDGRAKKDLIDLTKNKCIESKVTFIDRVSENEANNYIQFADCAYLSLKENIVFDMTIPAKLQSYMACGTPILGVVSGESERIITQAKCGVVCKQSVEDIKKGIIELKNKTQQEFFAMRKNAKDYFEKNFNIDMLINQFVDLAKEYVNK